MPPMSQAYPIVLLPGILGTRLYFPTSGRFWDPDSFDRISAWLPIPGFNTDEDNRHVLQYQNPAQIVRTPLPFCTVTREEVERGWGEVIWTLYGNFLRHLNSLTDSGPSFAL